MSSTYAFAAAGGGGEDLATHEAATDPHPGYVREVTVGQADGVASLDSSTKVPIAEIPTGSGGSQVAVGNHTHPGVKAFTSGRITSGNVNTPSNGAWQELNSKFRISVAAAVGDIILLGLDILIQPTSSPLFDVAVRSSGAISRYLSTGTSTPSGNGNPAFFPSPGTYRTSGLPAYQVLSGDVDGGTVTFTLAVNATSTGAIVYAEANNPWIYSLTNLGAPAA